MNPNDYTPAQKKLSSDCERIITQEKAGLINETEGNKLLTKALDTFNKGN